MAKKPTAARTFISITISVLFIVYLYVNRHFVADSLRGVQPQFFALAILGQILAQMANASVLRSTLAPLGVKLKFFESFRVTIVSSFVNFFTPVVGGASTKAVYLKSRHGLPYSSFAGALYANYIIMFLISFIFGLCGVLFIPGALNQSIGLILFFFFAGGIIGSALFIAVGHRFVRVFYKFSSKSRFLKRAENKILLVDEGWQNIRRDRETVASVSFWSVCVIFSLMLIYWASTRSIGIHTHFGSYMIYAALASVSLLFNLTPGSIGVRESLYASTYQITKISAQKVVTFSLVDRAAQLLVLGAAWLIFGHSVVRNLGEKQRQNP